MRSVATILGLVIALGGGYWLYQTYMTQGNLAQAPPQQQIDLVGIRSDLLAVGQAERQYLVTHGTYATLDQIRGESLATVSTEQRGYTLFHSGESPLRTVSRLVSLDVCTGVSFGDRAAPKTLASRQPASALTFS